MHLSRQKYGIHHYIVRLLGIISLVFLISACDRIVPDDVQPVPNQKNIDKSFFRNSDGTSKTFVGGWATVSASGKWGDALSLFNMDHTNHLNVQFKITEHFLIAQKVDPSFPSDKNRWETVLTIPITKHFYYEKAKANGKETNTYIENTGRSEWQHRPNFSLEFTQTGIRAYESSPIQPLSGTYYAEDIEWDKENNFLGFTLAYSSILLGSKAEARVRFNFMALKPTSKDFKKIPYHLDNEKKVNALFLLGKKIEGGPSQYHVAHWDTSKQHTIYLQGFPKRYLKMGHEVVSEWNDQFEAMKLGRPFVAKERKDFKYAFDLRYPSITWISDRSSLGSAPLGVAMVQTNVNTGEILWGGVNVWGSQFETYIKHYYDGSGGSSISSYLNNPGLLYLSEQNDNLFWPKSLGSGLPDGLGDSLSDLDAKRFSQIPGRSQIDLSRLFSKARKTLSSAHSHFQAKIEQDQKHIEENGLSPLKPTRNNPVSQDFRKELLQLKYKWGEETIKGLSNSKIVRNGVKEFIDAISTSAILDRDLTFSKVAAGWATAISKHGKKQSLQKTIDGAIKSTMSHEVGHMVGLGHNHQENILPKKGTIPSRYYKYLKSRADKNHTNMSTVMGYKNPVTTIQMPYEEIKPGIHDYLLLRLIYKGEYPVYNSETDKFNFHKTLEDGLVPDHLPGNPKLKTAFLPSCNDFEAVFYFEPDCARWDRGHDAPSLVKYHLGELDKNHMAHTLAVTANKGSIDPDRVYDHLWGSSLKHISRVRHFYDYMRFNYSDMIDFVASDRTHLDDFSSVCEAAYLGKDHRNNILLEKIKTSEEFVKLCYANKLAVIGYTKLISLDGPDFAKIDYDGYSIPSAIYGGDYDRQGQYSGIWKEMSVLPFKIPALHSLTSPVPYIYICGWYFPIPRYARNDWKNKVLYSNLYPEEYTVGIAEGVKNNLTLGNTETGENPTIKRTALMMGGLIGQETLSNEYSKFDEKYLKDIQGQYHYDFEYVAILLDAIVRKNTTKATGFKAKILNLQTDKSTSVSNGYLLKDGRVIVQGPKMFVIPVSPIKFFGDNQAFVMAYKISWEEEINDDLAPKSVKTKLREIYQTAIDRCLSGPHNNGLQFFFNESTDENIFEGFEIKPNIAESTDKQAEFQRSVDKAFKAYYKAFPDHPPTSEACRDGFAGMSMVTSMAASLRGYFLPDTLKFIEK